MILVTGGAGYVGSVLVGELLALGEDVRVVDACWFGSPFKHHERLELIKADVRAHDDSWLNDVGAVIHLAGLSNDPTADFAPQLNNEINVQATKQLARAVAEKTAREAREIRFLFGSTCSVYYGTARGEDRSVAQMSEDSPVAPTANYSKTKRMAEIELLRLAERYPLFCPVILRKGTIFGLAARMRFDLVLNTFTLQAWRKGCIRVHGHGEAWRPLLHIRDAVDAYIHLLSVASTRARAQVFNILHKNYRILELAHWVAEVLEQQRAVEVMVKRYRGIDEEARSYYVLGDRVTEVIGFRAGRGTSQAIVEIWDALERKEFGLEPENDPQYFNIRWIKEMAAKGAIA